MVVPAAKTLWGKKLENLYLNPDSFPTDEEIQEIDEASGSNLHGWMKSDATGMHIHYRKYLPESDRPRGIVVFLHGVHGHSGQNYRIEDANGTVRYTALGMANRVLTKAGFAVYAPDHMGHGFSEGKRFYIPDHSINRDDGEQFCRYIIQQHEDGDSIPFFLMGQSYGGALALQIGRIWQDNPERRPKSFKSLILVCPAVLGDLPPRPVVWTLRYGLAPLAPTWTPFFMPDPVSPDRLWTDEEVMIRATSPRESSMGLSAGVKAYSLGTAKSLLKALEKVQHEVIPGLTIPFMVAHGTDDKAVLIEGSEYLVEHCSTPEEDRKFLPVEGAKHDLFSEPKAEEMMEQIMDWVESRMDKQI